jgi:uncharacterized protein YdhG (YjbR/CyaY superfamily)
MKSGSDAPRTVDEYIAAFPPRVRKTLEQVRTTIRKAAPEAEEAMKYGIPTFTLGGNLVHFGAFKTHIGFYPTPSGVEAFRKELAAYEGAKGSVQFPLDTPMPLGLIERIVKFRVREMRQKTVEKKAVKKKAGARAVRG